VALQVRGPVIIIAPLVKQGGMLGDEGRSRSNTVLTVLR
jgi:hypothetical protein